MNVFRATLLCGIVLGLAHTVVGAGLDLNHNGMSDVWEKQFNASGLNPALDTDGDGFTNLQESIAGTNPFDRNSHPTVGVTQLSGQLQPNWPTVSGKQYQLLGNASLDPNGWQVLSTGTGAGSLQSLTLDPSARFHFFKVQVQDLDSDGDGLTDAEEQMLGMSATNSHTDRYDQTDLQRVTASFTAANQVTVALLDGEMHEQWPTPGIIAIRRSGGMQPITVNFTLGGTAVAGTDYTPSTTGSILVPMGSREVWVQLTPIAVTNDTVGSQTITLTATTGTGYTLGSTTTATATLIKGPANGLPGAKAACRFLIQAAFGPDQATSTGTDVIPANAQQVMAMGFGPWIDNQFTLGPNKLMPVVIGSESLSQYYYDLKTSAWWGRAMGANAANYPGGPSTQYDVLRQRVAFCLSQILVASDLPETLNAQPEGVANFYDIFEDNAFGNYRDILYKVTLHPVMGFYLSHLMNQKPNVAANIFPDENYAREIMQLFSIGLWQLNTDGTHKKDGSGNDIPTYDNTTITNFARVFTGLSYGGTSRTSFLNAPQDWTHSMNMWDAYHDMNPKTLLSGLTTSTLTATSSPDTGASGMADLNTAIDNIFNHPNVGPFVARHFIQFMVTSNPSPAYVGRVAAAFNNNGSGVRGDMQAVVKAVLMDDEARNPANMSNPNFGKQREPFLRAVNYARAFNASSTSGLYSLGSFFMDLYEEPMKSPSVFNFYLPDYLPPGQMTTAGLVGPEFQVINAASAIGMPNYFDNIPDDGMDRWGNADNTRIVTVNIAPELALASDVDGLIRLLNLQLTGGTLTPQEFQVIRESVARITTSDYDWQRQRVKLAIFLVSTSPEFCILR